MAAVSLTSVSTHSLPERRWPTHVVAHLSDTHLTGDGSLVDEVVDARAQLRAALDVLTSWNVRCDAWVFSGDLSDDGSPASYAWLRQQVLDAAAAAGDVSVVWAAGNHDDRAAFRAGLLDGSPADAGPLLTEHDLGGLRVLVLDTSIPGEPAGEVGPEALAWLGERLATRAEHGTLLVAHHPPLPPLQDAAWRWPLRNPGALAAVLAGSDVRAILSGHHHHSAFGTLAGIPVAAATSLVYTQDLTLGRDLRGQDAAQGFHLVEVYDDSVVHTVAPLARGTGVHGHHRARPHAPGA